jgi:hypothetical protein
MDAKSNHFKMHKYNALAMIGIKPPRPKRKLSPSKKAEASPVKGENVQV